MFSTNGSGRSGQTHAKKKKSKHEPYNFHKNYSKLVTDLNVKWNPIKLLNITKENLDDLGFGDGKICKEPLKFYNNKYKQPNQKCWKDFNKLLIKEDRDEK